MPLLPASDAWEAYFHAQLDIISESASFKKLLFLNVGDHWVTFLGAVKYDFGNRGFFIYYQLLEYIPWVIMGLQSSCSLPHKGAIH